MPQAVDQNDLPLLRRLARSLAVAVAVSACALVFGFMLFAIHVMRGREIEAATADGIVVLTGGEGRVHEGFRLLKEGHGKKLLISGVGRQTSKSEIEKLSGIDHKSFTCCVDLGYEALDTVGNADETRTWANANGYRKIIVVTSSYHMPRTLAELTLVMPDVDFLPHTVTPSIFPEDGGWWLSVRTTRVLLEEYLKYLPAAARLATQRAMGWREDHPVALQAPDPSNG